VHSDRSWELEPVLRKRLAALTLEQRVQLLTGADYWSLYPQPAAGLRRLVLSDGPVGVRGEFWDERDPSANLPSPTALAATWDEGRIERLGRLLAAEAHRKGVDVLLAPTVNLHRTPYGGRHFECYSEDPWLSGRAAAAYVRGVQSGGVATAVKHLVANDAETDRFGVDVRVDERTLRELYLLPFELAVVEGGAWALMAAYNRVNGELMTEHPMVRDLLGAEWGFDGLLVSDWFAARNTVPAGRHGLDLAMPGPDGPWGQALLEAVRAGAVPEQEIAEKALRILRLAARVGALSGVSAAAGPPAQPSAAELAEELRAAAAAGFVLVRNRGAVLPLDPRTRRVAVIGPNATHPRALGGGSATVFPPYTISPLNGIAAALGDGVEVEHVVGVELPEALPVAGPDLVSDPLSGVPGMSVRMLDVDGEQIAHEHRTSGALLWSGSFGRGLPIGLVATIEVRAVLTAPLDGDYLVGCSGVGPFRLEADGRALIDEDLQPAPGVAFIDVFAAPPKATRTLSLQAGQQVDLRLRHQVAHNAFGTIFKFIAAPPALDPEAGLAAAVLAAAAADVAVVVVGTTEEVESEGFDRRDLRLPGRQDELVRRVAAANPRTVVVVNAGAPVELPWAQDVAAILLTWFPGQEFGNALGDVLAGDREPGGRLPTTWPVAASAALPSVTPGPDGVLPYTEGLHIGYRRFARDGVAPRYWFGHGLGYTSWQYVDLAVPPRVTGDGDIAVSVRIRNSGAREGREVVQVYAERPDSAVERPVRWLVGYAGVRAEPGEEVAVEVPVPARALAYWDVERHDWVLEPGVFRLVAAPDAGAAGVSANLTVASAG
jgi:beta-glucosidase